MTTSTHHWFFIEEAMSEVAALITEVRAEQHRRAQRSKEADVLARWESDPTRAALPVPAPAEDLRRLAPGHLLAAKGEPPDPDGAAIVTLRARIRERFLRLKTSLAEGLNPHEVYFVLFPLVVHVDEQILSATSGRAAAWEPLQLDLFEIDDGGERFFVVLEDLLKKEDTLPLVLEAFYFCLKDGFVGLHAGQPSKLKEYQGRLVERLPQMPLPTRPRGVKPPSPVRLVELPRRVYGLAAAAVVVAFLLLQVLGTLEAQALSP